MTSSFSRGAVVRQYQYVPTHASVQTNVSGNGTASANGAAAAGANGRSNAADGAQSVNGAAFDVREVIAAAKQEAEALLAGAAAEAERLGQEARRQGYADGFETGLADGLAQADAKTAASIARMHHILDGLIAERSKVLAETESDLVGLALAISQKVIGDLADASSGVILHLAARAVDLLGNPHEYEMHVAPKDYEMVLVALEASNVPRAWTLVADERVAPGGCRVRHGAAQVDARPQEQLDLVQKAFDELALETHFPPGDGEWST